MKHHILYLIPDPNADNLPQAWRAELDSGEFDFLPVHSPKQAVLYAANYPVAGLLVDLDACGDRAGEWVASVREDERTNGLAIYGVSGKTPSSEEFEALVGLGFSNVFSRESPARFLAHQLETSRDLQKLRKFEQTGLDVNDLSGQTRKLLHDMSQPLSALQGQLQILQMRCGDKESAEYQKLSGLVELCMEVSRMLYATQELQRKFMR